MNYEYIDLTKWERGGLFVYFTEKMRNVISVTADIDVSGLPEACRRRGISFYAAVMWCAAKAVNGRENFRIGMIEGRPVRYDRVDPYYAHYIESDGKFVKAVAEYDDELSVFAEHYETNKRLFGERRGPCREVPPNVFDVSCLPWLHYKSLDLHVFDDGLYMAPVVTWGKYTGNGASLEMPMTLQIHHAVADGRHVAAFFEDAQTNVRGIAEIL